MDKIVWTADYSVGVDLMDSQHRRIIDLVNRLIDGHGTENDAEVVAETISKMLQYTREHFASEETLLLQYEYPACDDHRNLHRKFLKDAIQFNTAVMLKVDGTSTKLLEYLRDWWIDHILIEDMKYRRFFEGKGVTPTL